MNEFRRPPRFRPVVEVREVTLPSAPTAARPTPRTALPKVLMMAILPAMLPAVGFGIIALITKSSVDTMLPMVGMMGSMAVAVGVTTTMARRDEDARTATELDEHSSRLESYEQLLDSAEAEAAASLRQEAWAVTASHPAPSELVQHVVSDSPTVWERRPDDDDFLTLRLGVGQRKSQIKFTASGVMDANAKALAARYECHQELPVTVELRNNVKAGLFGGVEPVSRLLDGLIFQAAAQHSPWELSIVLLSRDEELCAWVKWLPHCVLRTSSSFQTLVARTGAEAAEVLGAVESDLQSRTSASDGSTYLVIADGRGWPSLSERLEEWLPSHASTSRIIAQNRFDELSGEFEFAIDVSGRQGRIRSRVEETSPQTFQPDVLWSGDALRGSLALAAIKTNPRQRHTPVPSSARLRDVLRETGGDAAAIRDSWSRSRASFRLAAPIGLGSDEHVVEIDLRRDGPHGLIAGTTGSGKSEFLQSLVVSLAARIPPDLLNFVLIDYKGGSAFRDVAALPHVVGLVTDLDERLATRALTSLRAEMRRREQLLIHSTPPASNIIEYQSQPRSQPLANLVILIDEFHRLVSEQPEFIEEMVQIAQQGRSLGIHLFLATQKPSGVVTDHIRANTNLRICLRVTDEADSRDVLGGPEAANIPRNAPGRLYLRVGNEPLVVCQAGRVSGLVPNMTHRGAGVEVGLFLPPLVPSSFVGPGVFVTSRTGTVAPNLDEGPDADLPLIDERAQLIEAMTSAAYIDGYPQQTAPWQEHLPEMLPLEDMPSSTSGTAFPIGLLDEPEVQRQRVYLYDLDDGNVCIAGGADTGKTTGLLTFAAAAARRFGPQQLHSYGIDFGGGALQQLQDLPNCGGVALQQDVARVNWVVQFIKDSLAERLRLEAAFGKDESQPRLLVLIDNFPAFYTWLQSSNDDAADEFTSAMDLGRSAGVTFVITVERPEALRASVLGLLQNAFLLDMREQTGYSVFGLSQVKRGERIAGRALLPGGFTHELQFAWPANVLQDLAATPTGGPGPRPISPLSTEMSYAALQELPGQRGLRIGYAEGNLPVLEYPLDTHLVVLGPRRSGRSNALAVAALEAWRVRAGRLVIFNPRRSPALRSVRDYMQSKGGADCYYAERLNDVAGLLDSLAGEINGRQEQFLGGSESFPSLSIFIDDLDTLDIPGQVNDVLQQVALRGVDLGTSLFVAGDVQALRASYPSGVTRTLLNLRQGILLSPLTPEDFDYFGVRGKPAQMPPGRGYYCAAAGKLPVQVARLDVENPATPTGAVAASR